MTTFRAFCGAAALAALFLSNRDAQAADRAKLAVRPAIYTAPAAGVTSEPSWAVRQVSWPYPYYAGWRGGYYRPYGFGYYGYQPYYGYSYAYRPWSYYGRWSSYYYPQYYGYSAYPAYYGYRAPYYGFYRGYPRSNSLYVGSSFYRRGGYGGCYYW